MKTTGYIRIISSADAGNESVMEFCITPNEKTPWHYHTLFSESFEVMTGTLEVGLNNHVCQLQKGDRITIRPNEKHCFHNTSGEDCLIRVTVSPGNKHFENALLILKGLANDGLSTAAGTPKKLTDLALFIYLNNSKMTGIQKIAAPFFNFLAMKAIKKGRLKALEHKYCAQDKSSSF